MGQVRSAVARVTPDALRRPARSVLEILEYEAAKVRTRHPETFSEKLRYKMLRDHRPLLTTFADKVAAREYVAARVGTDVLPKLLAVLDDARGLDPAELPVNFALKAAHASGGVVLVSDHAPEDGRLPSLDSHWPHGVVLPANVDWDDLRRLCAAWIARRYGGGPRREWAYVNVPRRIIIEELLADERGGVPADYKLFVFNRRCRLIQVDSNRFEEHHQDFFLPDWSWLDVDFLAASSPEPPGPPGTLSEMIRISELLGEETDMVRVDLYDVGGRVVFGELTSYPLGGSRRFRPESFDATVGSWWEIPARYE
ncbi:MAG: ATP-grasp fold amidoligase family protein [Acidimicrobiia bacterium]